MTRRSDRQPPRRPLAAGLALAALATLALTAAPQPSAGDPAAATRPSATTSTTASSRAAPLPTGPLVPPPVTASPPRTDREPPVAPQPVPRAAVPARAALPANGPARSLVPAAPAPAATPASAPRPAAPTTPPAPEPPPDVTPAEAGGIVLPVYSYRPKGCAAPGILIVFHGTGREAEVYPRALHDLAERMCLSIYAPLYDRERFPPWRYHRGGLVEDRALLPRDRWTVNTVRDLIAWARRREGAARPGDEAAPVILFGHSAGGQFLSRVAAFALPHDAARIVIANPSSWVVPDEGLPAPYGYGGAAPVLTPPAVNDLTRAYLAAPITVYLGTADRGAESAPPDSPAHAQGKDRFARGHATFARARAVAQSRGWPFNWRLVEAQGVGHSGRAMLQAPAFAVTLDPACPPGTPCPETRPR